MTVTIYHNPRCSKSRETLKLLLDGGVKPAVVDYLKNPPDVETLKSILAKLNLSPRQLMRKKEDVYAANKLGNESLSERQLLEAMVENPILIERPIVLANDKAALGRPPESVLKIL